MKRIYVVFILFLSSINISAQGIMVDDGLNKGGLSQVTQSNVTNIQGRNCTSLNGKWNAIIDPYDFGAGSWAAIWKDQKPKGKMDFYEYSFEGGTILDVPGDVNSQLSEFSFFEGTTWYKKKFTYNKDNKKRLFIHFGAINFSSDIYINSVNIGSHEGGFTPFQFEITDKVKEGENTIIVRANNQRVKDGIPALGFDWFNYGGITRDVNLVETPESYIEDYFIQLDKSTSKRIKGWVKLKGSKLAQNIRIQIPEAKIDEHYVSNSMGYVALDFSVKLQLWSPEHPKIYKVIISSETDKVVDEIGFRNITVKETDILLNGKSVFLKGVSFHEEIPQDKRRAYSESDALILLTWAKELGCNFIRLAHYPQNEYIVRMAEKMGFMLWEEIPVYQGIAFGDKKTQSKMEAMMTEMVSRDKNRCGIIIWSLSNETSPAIPRNNSLIKMANFTRNLDPTRLITSAFNKIDYLGNSITVSDTLSKSLDVIAVNEYLGWYKEWPSKPEDVVWKSGFNKPLIMSEFGAEALYGNHGNADVASSWSEEYQEQVYKDQIAMFKKIPFLKGTCPWVLVDFRSPRRLHPQFQDGQSGMWNRKGLLSDNGLKKKAWYLMKDFYTSCKND